MPEHSRPPPPRAVRPSRAALLCGWLCTPLWFLATLLTLLLWHPVILLTRHIHPRLHGWWVCLGNGVLLLDLLLVGCRVRIRVEGELPVTGPVIFVANHQSYFDIPILLWALRRYFPRFIAKKELERGMPSVSTVLRGDGSALVDRGDPHQALLTIRSFGARVQRNGWAACIFPEGTRARDGRLKPFKPAGLLVLLGEVPTAPVVPVVIDGAWELMRHGFRPVPFGVAVTVRFLAPQRRDLPPEEISRAVEERIRATLTASPSGAP